MRESAGAKPARPDVTVVLGAWSSGTSAVAAVAEALGLNAHPPHIRLVDENTPKSGESRALRHIFADAFDHGKAVRLATPRWLVPRLTVWAGPGRSVAKMPLLAWFLPEVMDAWEARFLIVRRDLAEIEATRVRRGWPGLYGRSGAKMIYRLVDEGLPPEAARLEIAFDDLRQDPVSEGARIAAFLGVCPQPDRVKAAVRVT